MAEGDWAKSNGDIFFASEANSLRQNGFFLTKNDFDAVGSSTDGIPNGSLVIPVGSLAPICYINIYGDNDLGLRGIPRLEFSGTDFGTTFTTVGTSTLDKGDPVMNCRGNLASGVITVGTLLTSDYGNTGPIRSQGDGCFPNSGLVIFFNLQHSGITHNWRTASVKFTGFYSGTNIGF